MQIKIARVKANIKALELAKQLNISPTLLSLIENEHKECPEHIYKRLTEILKDI